MKIKLRTKQKKTVRIEQWIEIHHQDGKTVTSYHPTNEEIEKKRLEMDPPPELIYRRLNFFQGVPFEYMWINPPETFKQYGGQFLQRVTVEEWPAIVKAERDTPYGHVISAKRSVGRPPELGPCHCEKCTEERDKGLPSRFDQNK